ncbi:hypothetical protein GXW78_03210 [Roseomonas terrae]|jgi:hypothetical protein|uniref:Uncharacterized protein n=1 Tax=Neoroseomonas terrae TaxID=424799 RepID=A0ABS5ED75_9PROT|nr:hypothetical protein [Neoroseomonas terrae]MBR0648657.1 hypothetical protein [Neoroseomonas terrae]
MTGATSITVRVPLKIRRRPGRKTVVTPVPTAGANTAIATRADPALLKALARAFRYQRLLDEGRYASISEMAVAERIDRGYLGSLLRLTLLPPDVVEAVLEGTTRYDASLPDLFAPLPTDWAQHRAALLDESSRCDGARD